MAKEEITDLVVIGSGPGGYTAAFRAADLGVKVTLVEYHENLGGVCLNVGCIPSKSLLNVAELVNKIEHAGEFGINVGKPKIDLKKIRAWKDKVTGKLTMGLKGLAKKRNVQIIRGEAKFLSSNSLVVNGKEQIKVQFKNAIIAAGSSPVKLPFIPDDPRVLDSTKALELADIPGEMLVIGGGIIGMELGSVYQALGSQISVVELMPTLMPGADVDLVKPFQNKVSKKFKAIMLKTKVTAIEAKKDGLWVSFAGEMAPKQPLRFDKVLVAVGRVPNGNKLAAEKAGVNVNAKGFIPVNKQLRTNVAHIFAIGDIVGEPMLAHKAIPEGKIAAEVVAGKKHFFTPLCIPNVAYTDPEIAWVGLTEKQAKEKQINYGKGVFPWMASGRSLALGREEGITKVLFDKATNKVIGAGIVGPHAGDLISEVGLAIEMGCDAEDLGLTIHPHPTLSETVCQAAEAYTGSITDLIPNK